MREGVGREREREKAEGRETCRLVAFGVQANTLTGQAEINFLDLPCRGGDSISFGKECDVMFGDTHH